LLLAECAARVKKQGGVYPYSKKCVEHTGAVPCPVDNAGNILFTATELLSKHGQGYIALSQFVPNNERNVRPLCAKSPTVCPFFM